jgi:hypothetical protein
VPKLLMHLLAASGAAAAVAAATGCAPQPARPPTPPSPPAASASVPAAPLSPPATSPAPPPATPAPFPSDPRTRTALLKVATVFNDEYDRGDYGPVYDRWDARSQAIITKAEYIRRRTECPSASHATALVESASPGPHGAWRVDYEISGDRLVDYWFYVHGRWVFDLVMSNPSAVKLYRMSPAQYVAAVGCAH